MRNSRKDFFNIRISEEVSYRKFKLRDSLDSFSSERKGENYKKSQFWWVKEGKIESFSTFSHQRKHFLISCQGRRVKEKFSKNFRWVYELLISIDVENIQLVLVSCHTMLGVLKNTWLAHCSVIFFSLLIDHKKHTCERCFDSTAKFRSTQTVWKKKKKY